ncbi:Carboxylesterase, type B [Penicillium occitanis (nom. inval.)]|nr:Carboxylesterase, type B [Penicillium occitanis (nom. inval.)]PCG95812.1 hypothetical protein PENOC_076040 [Penicillium occitanis (nom. inval.)]
MHHTTLWTFLLSSWIPFSLANPQIRPPSNPFPKRNLPNSSNPLEVDLGYAGYAGVYDVPNSLKYWYGTPEPTQPVGSEDCLFLNVWAPENATDLPVFVWIHGGGYGYDNAQFDMPFLMNATVNKYIIVDIQYRLGAYGFLAGDEVYKHGTTSAGLYDQYLALQWVQKYISLFGGDPDRVTIGGIPAGLFLALNSATCADRTNFEDAFHYLVEQDTLVLMDANWNISYGAKYGEWAFLPVADNKFVQKRPSEQLVKGNLNEQRERRRNVRLAKRHTEDDFVDFAHYLFPQFMDEQFEAVLAQYSIPADIPTVRFATDGLNKNGNCKLCEHNLYAETTFDCPAYWMAEGFNMKDGQSYKYQVSIINSLHGEDETVYLDTFGPVNYLAPLPRFFYL